MTYENRARLRSLGISVGHYPIGELNAITDVAGVRVGHVTCIEGDRTRTGATAILPHAGNLFQDKVPAALAVFNGFGKFAGSTQIAELGEIETPILLTNTLGVGRAIEAINRHTLAQAGNERVVSLNAVVGETNDSRLNDIRAARPSVDEMLEALSAAKAGPVEEGALGAGTGTVAFGLKGGIGTSSRIVSVAGTSYTVGVLVQSNYGGKLIVAGRPYEAEGHDKDGSIVMIVATDAPLCSRNLERLAERCFGGLARTGAALSNGSGDYALAFSTAEEVRRTPARRKAVANYPVLSNDVVSPLFEAVIEASEEAILNSMTMATTTHGYNAGTDKPSTIHVISLDALKRR
ncbi:P1 family peptidase [Neorhizobium alkalisoli]|uniref:L-aminopeptidase DmpA n=1 Tax=Neorhizobium alkalisoli TaxID=528178 RepID=A0A561R9N9_9HYPH|nr:P1 family peptidase [Neorhizobium alkalisoli]TWF59326.1 L-aminopeptidase DmpA [Neorhizobium alkalisoli]